MRKFKEHVISIRDFGRDEIVLVLDVAAEMEEKAHFGLLSGYVLGTMFFEPSTRTRFSFTSAMLKLGGQVLDMGDPQLTSVKKGESLADSIKIISGYCDVIAIRHSWEGAARLASQIANVPVMNGGDGANQHPTQTFLDLYTIGKTHKRIDGLSVGFVGDLKYSRTVHSLAEALMHFDCRQFFISHESLRVPRDVLNELDEHSISYQESESLPDILPELDILYCTRIQEERFADRVEYEKVKGIYRTDRALLEGGGAKDGLRIMHPLPRRDELATDLDGTPYAIYFDQAKNGIPVRQALLALLLGKA